MAEPERHDREQLGDQPRTTAGGTGGRRHEGRTEPTPREAHHLSPDSGGDRGLAVAAHLLGIVTSFIGPLVIMLTAGKDSTYVRDQAREALNFQITVLIALVAAFIAFVVLIGPILVVVVAVVNVVLCIAGAVKAGQGAAWRYPVATRLVR